MGAVIDETLDYCHRYTERPERIVMGANNLNDANDVTFTLTSGGPLSVSDVVEFNKELMLVTAMSADSDPIYTVARGYLSTTNQGQVVTATAGGANPLYPRYTVQRAVERCNRVLNKELPFIKTEEYTRETDKQLIDLPADTIRVLEVGFMNLFPGLTTTENFRYTEAAGWQFIEDLPVDIGSGTTKILRTPSYVTNGQSLIVKRQVPYVWSDESETGTLEVPVGSEELPVLFATARLVSGREISRSEIDRVEEWNHEAAIRGGVNLRLLSSLWQDFYHAVEEAKSVQYVPKMRPYRRMPRLNSVRTVRWVP